MTKPKLKIKRLSPDAIIPRRGSEKAIGLDLFAAEDVTLFQSGYVYAVGTGISVAIPSGYYGRIAPRSGLARKYGIDTLAGVIDEDFRGEVVVLLTMHKDHDIHEIEKGERIAQLILERADIPDTEEVTELDETERGSGGFGSSGR